MRQLTLELARSKQSFYPTIRNGATRAKLCLEEVLKVFVQTDFTAAVEKILVCAKALQAGCTSAHLQAVVALRVHGMHGMLQTKEII